MVVGVVVVVKPKREWKVCHLEITLSLPHSLTRLLTVACTIDSGDDPAVQGPWRDDAEAALGDDDEPRDPPHANRDHGGRHRCGQNVHGPCATHSCVHSSR